MVYVKERVKSLILVLLLISAVFLTYRLWFTTGAVKSGAFFSWDDIPFVSYFLHYGQRSIPKENLSKPRKIVINDGSLWVPYYNTDDAFDTLDDKTSEIIAACLSGEAEYEAISYQKWLGSLEERSIYVEYPITVTPDMLGAILGSRVKSMPDSIKLIKDAIIIPVDENGVNVAMRDADGEKAVMFTVEGEKYAFPGDVLSLYADRNKREGYYEFAFSTMLGSSLPGGVTVNDLVLFSDNDASIPGVSASNPLTPGSYGKLLRSFSFAAQPLRHYRDEQNCENYVENYATVKIYENGCIEYMAVVPEKGIFLTESGRSEYELLNSAIDFAEKVWSSVSQDTLNVLVSGVYENGDEVKFTFDYYAGGREVAVTVADGISEPLYHAIEITVKDGRVISYRQYMRKYAVNGESSAQESFVSALDYFVGILAGQNEAAEIADIYPGYFDDGSKNHIKATWLARTSESEERIPMREVNNLEMEQH